MLEQIVEGSTAMFERLAQFEDFHYTVDLPILVSAAQEKVIKWLAKWQPKKGRLFSWFSKSLSGDSRVMLADGTTMRIDAIVRNRLPVSVVTWDEEMGAFTARSVSDWIVSEALRSSWRKVSVQHPAGFNRVLFATHDHEFQTQRGWVAVDDLQSTDLLYLRTPRLTAAGIEAVVGMYLGDGHINCKHALVAGHGRKQKFYVEYLAAQFDKNVYDGECVIKGKRYYSNSVCIPLRAAWPEYKQLPRRKSVNQFVLSHLTPLALAYWFMDDGSFDAKRGAVKFATDGFSRRECLSLKTVLEFRYGVVTHYHQRKGKNYGYLQVQAESRQRLFELIGPYVLDGFRYKMPGSWRGPSVCPPLVAYRRVPCSFKSRGIIGHTNIRNGRNGPGTWFTPDFSKKYDITVPGTRNFVAEGVVVHNCAKNAFRSELVKVNQYRKRYHVTSDHLEKFYGVEDHEVDKHDIAEELRCKLDELTVRWGDPQEIGAIRFLTLCIIDDEHDKQAAIKSASYAFGISFELSKFFYNWSIVNLRHAFYEKVYVPFTGHDLMMASESYTFLPEFVNIFGIEKTLEGCTKLGGQRVKFPTLQYLAKLRENHLLARDIERSDLDPDAVAEIARKHKKTPRTAQEVFNEMVEQIDPRRYGEHSIFHEDSADE